VGIPACKSAIDKEFPMDFAISLYDALIAINVPSEKAKSVVSALEHDMTTALATKDDVMVLTDSLRVLTDTISFKFTAQTTEFDLKLKAQTDRIVIRLGTITIAAMAALEALHKFL
jgi:hypothetical protein